jgi:peptidoglycan/xylan/chitin deacetylase (PgdA/CDA1 family)
LKATFFVVGKNCQKFPQILKEIVKEGHSIGNHSFSHSIKFFFDFKREIERTREIIKEITGIETKNFPLSLWFFASLLEKLSFEKWIQNFTLGCRLKRLERENRPKNFPKNKTKFNLAFSRLFRNLIGFTKNIRKFN